VLKANEWLETDHVLTTDLDLPYNECPKSPQRQMLCDRLIQNVKTIPGFRTAGFTNGLPLRGGIWTDSIDVVEVPKTVEDSPNANLRFVSPGYFGALGLTLVQGRVFDETDAGKEKVVISEGIAKGVLKGRNPIGLHVRWHSPETGKELHCEITGVAADARTDADAEAPLTMYFPHWIWNPESITLVVRTSSDPRASATDLRKTIHRTDSQIAIPREETMSEVLSEAVAPRRFVAWLGTLFAIFATFLAALGLYGVIALAVTQRTQEIGVRMALGARGASVLRLIITKGIAVSLAGIVIGLGAAVAITRLIAGLLYGVRPGDPVTFAGVGIMLLATTLLACYVPARRATRIDPLIALRFE
jgi:putative ABC transport system permease protein